VRTGASLTITCEVRMGEGKRIIVRRGARLVVDKGKITKLCDGKWGGIAVHGNANKIQPDTLPGQQASDDAGIVIIRNNSLVEHAGTAIFTEAPDYFWDYNEQTNRWGGLVVALDSRFENNKRTAAFMKYDFPNASIFHNCTFEDGEQGVTIWRANGIRFSRNRFYNLSGNGILAHNAGAIVTDGNSFENNGRGIRTFASHPMATNNGWMIIGEIAEEPNKFENNVVHIHAEASDYGSATNVYNNEFFGGKVSVWSFGPSRFDLRNNVFDTQDQASVVLSRTGALGVNQLKYVRDNFIKAPRGIFGIGENRELQFLCNQFLSGEDFVLEAAKGTSGQILALGRIRNQQGSSAFPAGNCFTDPQQTGDIVTIPNETVSFTYYAFSGSSAPACRVPVTSGNYIVIQALGNECEPGPTFNDNPGLQDFIDILDEIAVSHGSASTTPEQLAALYEEKSWVFHHLLNEYYEVQDTSAIFNLLSLENSSTMQMMKFGLELNLGNFTAAAATLDSLPNTIPEMTDFKQIQQINIARMQQGLAYAMPVADSVYLESIAQSELGVKSYARAILSLVYGLEFNDVLEDGEVHLEERQTPDKEESLARTSEKLVRVFPNPANDGFTVAMEGFEPGQLRVVSVLGAAIYAQTLTPGTTNVYVPTAEWSDGVYFLQIFDTKGALVHAARVSVTH
jgi:hypothetical protein